MLGKYRRPRRRLYLHSPDERDPSFPQESFVMLGISCAIATSEPEGFKQIHGQPPVPHRSPRATKVRVMGSLHDRSELVNTLTYIWVTTF